MPSPRFDGSTPGPGRKPGVPNKVTTAFKTALLDAFNQIGGADELARWGRLKANRAVFYQICARLVPTEVVKQSSDRVIVLVGVGKESFGPNPWEQIQQQLQAHQSDIGPVVIDVSPELAPIEPSEP